MNNKQYTSLALSVVTGILMLCLGGCVSSGNIKNASVDKAKALDLHVQLARGYVEKANRESARHHLRKAAEINKNSADATEVMALLYQLEGETQLAEAAFKKAIRAKKNFTIAYNDYGVFLFENKRYEEALAQFELAAADLDYNGRGSALINVGRTAAALGHRERARSAFEHAAILDRNLSEAHIELADMYLADQDYAKAKDSLDRYQSLSGASARSLLIAIRLERIFGNRDKEASHVLMLKNRFPYSREYLDYKQSVQER